MTVRNVRLACTVLAALLLSGCFGTTGPKRDVNDPTSSLVFVHIDMEDAPTKLAWVSLRQAAPKGQEGYWSMEVEQGLAFNQYVPAGSFQVEQFGGSGFLSGDYTYSFPTHGANETAVRIQKPGVYFLGSFKYLEVKTKFFAAGKFDIERVKAPGEVELLGRMLKMKGIKGTQWEARIQARLAALKK